MTIDTAQPSGRELDALVAERLFDYYRDARRKGPFTDWHEAKCGGDGRCAPLCGFNLPNYSTDIGDAHGVVVEMAVRGWSFACTIYQGKLPYASFCRGTAATSRNAEAESLPEAICRAALAAIGPKE